ncbi:hypothetical protein ACN2WE_13225 [Streptomyces sp. cg28]|uniref:hypothetical protein n=1 Tax=Streptomyces sp. cg28 TaxID=3403457 RepID=UPI003B21669C
MTDIERDRQKRENGLQHDPETTRPDAKRDETVAATDRDLTRDTEKAPDRDLTRGTETAPGDRDLTRDPVLDTPRSTSTGTGTGATEGTGAGIPTDADIAPRKDASGTHRSATTEKKPGDTALSTPAPGRHKADPLATGTGDHERGTHHRDNGHVGDHGNGNGATDKRLVPTGTHDEFTDRLRQAVTGFVDQPRASVEEADHVLEDLTARLAETLAGHHRTLRTSWQESADDTEKLRLALRDYRETAEKLLKL